MCIYVFTGTPESTSLCLYFDLNELGTVTLDHLPSTLDLLPSSLDKKANSTNVTRVRFRPVAVCELRLLLVIAFLGGFFSPVTPVFFHPEKPITTSPNFNSTGIEDRMKTS